jgi:hypothetical protein
VRLLATSRANVFVDSKDTCRFTGTTTWSPRDPLVFTNDRSFTEASAFRSSSATSHASRSPAPGPGSRSNTTIVGTSMVAARISSGWNSIADRFAAHSRLGRSSITQ